MAYPLSIPEQTNPANDMHILITGAGGKLGSRLRHYLEGRYDLLLTSPDARREPEMHPADLSIWNEEWDCLLEGIGTVIHLAANPSPKAPCEGLVSPNIDMVLNVYEAAVAQGVGRVVFASSNHVMSGYRTSKTPILRSDTPPNPGNAYGASKLFGERIGRSFSDRHGISSINVRIGWYGPEPNPDMDDWDRQMWLSDTDYCHLMKCCIEADPSIRWAVINGVSKNTASRWDLSEARRLVGYSPQDDAFDPRWW